MKLLLLDVRGLQAGAAGPYGNRWIESYSLAALAAQGVVFDRHLSVHPEPGPARLVWRSGRHPFTPAEDGADLLAVLRERGVATHLIVDTSRPTPPAFLIGWDHVHEAGDTPAVIDVARKLLSRLDAPPGSSGWKWRRYCRRGTYPTKSLTRISAKAPPEEVAAEEEGGDPLEEEEDHEPLLDPPMGHIDPNDDDLYLSIQKSYAAAVSHVDILLGLLLDGMPDDVLVILTADAGQALGERGQVGGTTLHVEGVQVPLLFAGAGCRAGRHVGGLTASVDLAPTIAELAGATLPGGARHKPRTDARWRRAG